jgi:hypothetical protein
MPNLKPTAVQARELIKRVLGRELQYGERLVGQEQKTAADALLGSGIPTQQDVINTRLKNSLRNAQTGRQLSPGEPGGGYPETMPLEEGQRLLAQQPGRYQPLGGASTESRVVAPVEPGAPNDFIGGLRFDRERIVPATTSKEQALRKELLPKVVPAGQELPQEQLPPAKLKILKAFEECEDVWTSKFGKKTTNRGSLETMFRGAPHAKPKPIPPVDGARGHTDIKDFFQDMFTRWRLNPSEFKKQMGSLRTHLKSMVQSMILKELLLNLCKLVHLEMILDQLWVQELNQKSICKDHILL